MHRLHFISIHAPSQTIFITFSGEDKLKKYHGIEMITRNFFYTANFSNYFSDIYEVENYLRILVQNFRDF